VDAVERFWAKVDVQGPDECWDWTGASGVGGYGVIGKRTNGRQWQLRAHRMSAAIHFGMFDRRLDVLHTCDNPRCVNPAHLYLGTDADNARDRGERRRSAQSKRTHCPQGHTYDDSNTRVYAGKRHCRMCDRLRAARIRNEHQSNHPTRLGHSRKDAND
jgi:hypothetical protein